MDERVDDADQRLDAGEIENDAGDELGERVQPLEDDADLESRMDALFADDGHGRAAARRHVSRGSPVEPVGGHRRLGRLHGGVVVLHQRLARSRRRVNLYGPISDTGVTSAAVPVRKHCSKSAISSGMIARSTTS